MRKLVFLVWASLSFGQAQAGDLSWYLWQDVEGIDFGGFVTDLRAVKVIASEDGKDKRIVYGDKQGQIHVVRFEKDRFQDEWTSPTLRSAIAEIFIADVNVDDEVEIVAYTELGDIVFYMRDLLKSKSILSFDTSKRDYYNISIDKLKYVFNFTPLGYKESLKMWIEGYK